MNQFSEYFHLCSVDFRPIVTSGFSFLMNSGPLPQCVLTSAYMWCVQAVWHIHILYPFLECNGFRSTHVPRVQSGCVLWPVLWKHGGQAFILCIAYLWQSFLCKLTPWCRWSMATLNGSNINLIIDYILIWNYQ